MPTDGRPPTGPLPPIRTPTVTPQRGSPGPSGVVAVANNEPDVRVSPVGSRYQFILDLGGLFATATVSPAKAEAVLLQLAALLGRTVS